MFSIKLNDKHFYKTIIDEMNLRFLELQGLEAKARKIRVVEGLKNRYKDFEEILYYQKLFFILETI